MDMEMQGATSIAEEQEVPLAFTDASESDTAQAGWGRRSHRLVLLTNWSRRYLAVS